MGTTWDEAEELAKQTEQYGVHVWPAPMHPSGYGDCIRIVLLQSFNEQLLISKISSITFILNA